MHPVQAAKKKRSVKRREFNILMRSVSFRKLMQIILNQGDNRGTK
jgi:hypothetical protein